MSSLVKQSLGNVMTLVCMAASGIRIILLVVTHDGSNRRNLVVCRNAPNLTGKNFIMQDNDPKYTGRITKDIIWDKKLKVLDRPNQ